MKRLATGFLIAGSALVLAACNGTSSSAAASAPGTAPASGATGGQGGGIVSTLTKAVTKSTTLGSFTMTGVTQATGGTVNVTAQVQTSPYAEELTESGSALSGLSAGGKAPASVRMIIDNGNLYENLGSVSSMSGGKPWTEISLSSISSTTISASQSDSEADPLQMIRFLAASGDLSNEGTQVVDGTTTTHYHGTVTPGQLLAATTTNLTTADHEELALMRSQGITSDMIDIWVDGQDRPVQVAVTESDRGTTTHSEFQLSGWGTPVHITPPPASEVEDLTGGAGGAASEQP